jgi:hypothetical protein
MKRLCLLCLLVLTAPALAAESPLGISETVQAEGLSLSARDLVFTDKKSYLHLLWDTFPSKAAIEATAASRGLPASELRKKMAVALLEQKGQGRSKAKTAKVDVVEFPERDVYGDPVWGSVVKLDRFELPLGHAPAKASGLSKGKKR